MVDHPQQHVFHAKAVSLKAIMNHAGLRSSMVDALHSVPGSTKRKRAEKVLMSLEKVHRNKAIKDGKGGAWWQGAPVIQGALNNAANYTGSLIGEMGNVAGNAGAGMIQGMGDVANWGVQNAPYFGSAIASNIAGTPMNSGAQYQPIGKILKSPTVAPLATVAAASGQPSVASPTVPIVEGPYTGKPQSQLDAESAARTASYQQNATNDGLTTNPNETADQAWGSGSGSGSSSGTGTDTGSSSSSISGAYPLLQDTLSKGLGPNYYAYQLMTNKAAWDKEFPGTPFPNGLGTSDDIKKDMQTIKDGYGVDKLRDNLTRLGNMGLNIQSDMTNYVAAKDTYVKKIDSMLDDAKNKYASMDTSLPEVQQQMSNYMSYLTVLKGRQQQRYGDWLKSNMDLYTNNLNAATNQFNAVYSAYQSALTAEQPVWTDLAQQKDTMFKMLGDMYTNAAALPDQQIQRQANSLSVLAGIVGLKNTLDTANGGGATPGKGILDLNSTQYDNTLKLMGVSSVPVLDASGVQTGKKHYDSLPNDYYGAVTKAAQAGVDPTAAKQLLNQELNNMVESYFAEDNTAGLNNLKTMFSTMKQQYDAETDPTMKAQIQQDMANLTEAVGTPMYNGFSSLLGSKSKVIDQIANELVKGWYKPGDSNKRNVLVNQYSNGTGLSKSMVGDIFTAIDKNYGPLSRTDYFPPNGKTPGASLTKVLLDYLTTSYGLGFGNYQNFSGLPGQ